MLWLLVPYIVSLVGIYTFWTHGITPWKNQKINHVIKGQRVLALVTNVSLIASVICTLIWLIICIF